MIKTNNQNTVKTRQKFDQTFKREAVNNWLTSGKSASVVAVELGILPNRLYAWQQRFAPADAGGKAAAGATPSSAAELQTQLDAARREIRHLTEQRDILKKTLGILSEPSPNAMNGSTR
jgi:transposase-like protein